MRRFSRHAELLGRSQHVLTLPRTVRMVQNDIQNTIQVLHIAYHC
jgi:hypothetical protein